MYTKELPSNCDEFAKTLDSECVWLNKIIILPKNYLK